MKRLTILFLLISTSIFSLYAARECPQQRLSPKEFREKQKEFIISKANLTPVEADRFFPIFFELQEKKRSMNDKIWELIRSSKDKNLTEEQYGSMLDEIYNTRIAIDELEKSYLERYRKILNNKQIFLIQNAEMRFHREIIRTMNPPRNQKDNSGRKNK